jgi:hypothetical protein
MISGFHVDKMPDEKELGHKHLEALSLNSVHPNNAHIVYS